MNKLSILKRTQIIATLIEGNSICATCRTPYLATPASLKKTDKHFCSPECKGVYAAKSTPNKNTSIERAIEKAIKERGWFYEKQVPLAGICLADFYLPEFNAVVFCDGDYWHGREIAIARDARQNEILTRKGYKVFRFTETEIKRSAQDCLDLVARSTERLFAQLALPTA